jgi:hypothetical protein
MGMGIQPLSCAPHNMSFHMEAAAPSINLLSSQPRAGIAAHFSELPTGKRDATK